MKDEMWKLKVVLKEVKGRIGIVEQYIGGCYELMSTYMHYPEVTRETCDVPPGADAYSGHCPHCGVAAYFSGTSDWLHKCASCKRPYFVRMGPDDAE